MVQKIFRLVAGLVLPLSAVVWGCSRSPDFGTLPRVEVPLGAAPKQASPPAQTSGMGGAEQGSDSANRRQRDEGGETAHDLPDPPALYEKHHVRYQVAFDRGELSILSYAFFQTAQPQPTDRRLGRYAFELWLGAQLIERVRFDFPLLGAGAQDGDEPLEAGLSTSAQVLVPRTDRANRARILDRKTRKTLEVEWPPEAKAARE